MPRSPLSVKLSVQVYGLFTWIYPSAFRRQFGHEMTQMFEDWATDEWHRRNWIGLAAVWFRAIVDLFRGAASEHAASLQAVALQSETISVSTIATSRSLFAHKIERRSLVIMGTGFAILNGLLWFTTPVLRAAVDASAGRLDDPTRPFIIRGVQELLVYFDPWLAWYVFPPVFTIGFASIPFLWISKGAGPNELTMNLTTIRLIATLLVLLEMTWLFLTWVGVCCRGPHWNFYWPGEIWDATRTDAIPTLDFSNYFWTNLFGLSTHDMSWLFREMPGFLITLAYFLVGFLLVRKSWGQKIHWPVAVTTIVLLLAISIPMKMCCRALWDIRYVVSIPEMQLNI